jgi:hypothetical protein
MIKMYVGIDVKYIIADCNESQQIFEKSSNIKFNENLSIGSRFVP